MLSPWRLLIWQLAVKLSFHVTAAGPCLGGEDIFTAVRENSPAGHFIANLSATVAPPGANTIRLCLSGQDADWFFLEGRAIRLNSSLSRILDREVQGSILIAELTCYEDDVMQSRFRIIVEILNENDNKPQFVEKTIQPFYITEVAAVNSVIFTVEAIDADMDTISYMIDKSLLDASYFRIDLPNSGKVLLDKPLDYESKTQLQLVIYAVETGTREKYNTSATLTIHVKDGDDQYPQFLPCSPASSDISLPACVNPVYTTNITERDQDMVLEFAPGPINAEDGDRGLDTLLTYTILSGADNGRFVIDNRTGEITLTRPVDRRRTPTLKLHIMASQLNDPMKYSVTVALVRVLAENGFPPVFNRTLYKGFVIKSASPATLVATYGNQVLLVQATDKDFRDGVNPKIHYTLRPQSASEGLYQVTREGVVIARTDRLRAFDRHLLEVVARDEESGEEGTTSLDVEVLPRGQPVPRGPFKEEHLFGDVDTKLAGGIAGVLFLLLAAALFLLLRMFRRRRSRRDPADQGAVTLGRHPNVVNVGRPAHLMEDISYSNEAFTAEPEHSRSGSLHGRRGVYTRKQSLPTPLLHFLKSDPERSSRPLGGAARGVAMKDRALVSIQERDETCATITGDAPSRIEGLRGSAGRGTAGTVMVWGDMTGATLTEVIMTEQEEENPYKAMHAVICDSDEEETST